MKEYIVDCVELVKKHKRFLIKAYLLIMVVYTAMAVIAIKWYDISQFLTKFRSGKCALKWNPGRVGKFVSYDADDETSYGLDPEEVDAE